VILSLVPGNTAGYSRRNPGAVDWSTTVSRSLSETLGGLEHPLQPVEQPEGWYWSSAGEGVGREWPDNDRQNRTVGWAEPHKR